MQDDAVMEVRRVVSVVFADLVGSTSLGDGLDVEVLREITGRYFELMREVVERHGGSVEKFIGDAVVAVFGVPHLREDDALRAVRAALGMCRGIERLASETADRVGGRLQIRVGVNTGEAVLGPSRAGGSFATGDALNVAARLQQAARPGEVLIGAGTHDLVRTTVSCVEVPALALKGKSDTVPAWRVVRGPGDRHTRGEPRTPLVGREESLEWLRTQLSRACSARAVRRAAVIGEPGLGKTRLCDEFTGALDDEATVLTGRCLSYGEGTTLWPVREALIGYSRLSGNEPPAHARAAFTAHLTHIEDKAAAALRLSAICGFEPAALVPEDVPWALRALLTSLAVRRPVVLVVDDLHWAEPGLIDILERASADMGEDRLLLLSLARPEVRDTHPGWLAMQDATLSLGPLDEEAVETLLRGRGLTADVSRRVVRTAGGNPLFAEQLAAMVEDQTVRRAQARPGAPGGQDPEDVVMPPTVSVLLASRLELLPRDERALLEAGSVIGTTFYRQAITLLTGDPAGEETDRLVSALEGKNFIGEAASDLPGQRAYRFVHALVADVAYTNMTKAARAQLHVAFADWLLAAAGSTAPDDVVGFHLERAWRDRTELAQRGPETALIAARASRHLARAGHRLQLSDANASAKLHRKAAAVLPPGDPRRIEPLLDLSWTLSELGRSSEAQGVLDDAVSEFASDPVLAGRARLLQSFIAGSVDSTASQEDTARVLDEVRPLLEATDNDAVLSDVHLIQSRVELTRMRFDRSGRLLDLAIHHAELAGDHVRAMRARGYLVLAHMFGSTPAEEAIHLLDDLVRRHPDELLLRAMVEQATCVMHAMGGRFVQARAIANLARKDLTKLGQAVFAANLAQSTGTIEEYAGDFAAADREYALSCAALDRLGENAYLSTVAGMHARLLARTGHDERARRACRLARASVSPGDVVSYALIEEAEAFARVRGGDLAGAEAAIGRSLALTEGSESPNDRAEQHVSGAQIAELSGNPDLARTHLHQALSLFTSKGNTVRAGEVAARLRAL